MIKIYQGEREGDVCALQGGICSKGRSARVKRIARRDEDGVRWDVYGLGLRISKDCVLVM